jgi:transmembrane sensor
MDESYQDIDQLIALVLSGNATSVDFETVEQCRNSSPENQKHYELSLKAWENSPRPLTKIEIEKDRGFVEGEIITRLTQQEQKKRFIIQLLRVAAVLLAPIMLGLGWFLGSREKAVSDLSWNSVTAPKRHIAVCNLADGTEVWLNAGSTISYPSTQQKNQRQVKLNGEAYFKVSKDKQKPFTVLTDYVALKVLGTTFNLKAYSNDPDVVATLEEGAVQFQVGKAGSSSVELKPGEQIVYHTDMKSIDIKSVDPKLSSAWRNEKYLFRDADLKTILTELERLYDIKIYIKNPKLEKLRFRGMFSYDQDILDAFETLSKTVKINYTIKDRVVWLE